MLGNSDRDGVDRGEGHDEPGHGNLGLERRALVENEQSIRAEEEQLLKVHERAQADPECEDARIARLAEVYVMRNDTDLATAIAAVQRMDEGS
jgi:hypothetical protein